MIRLGTSGWELYSGPRCEDCEPYPGLRDRSWARVFVQTLTKEALAAGAIRHLLSRELLPWPLTRITDDDAIDHMAVLLSRGIWHVHAPVLPRGAAPGSELDPEPEEEDEAEIVRGPAARPEPAARPQPVEEEGSLPRSADEAAIANTLKLASQLGIPFCEECAKASLKRAREVAVA